jgi:hypothetical protein
MIGHAVHLNAVSYLCKLFVWTARGLRRARSLLAVSKVLSKHASLLVGVQEVTREGGGPEAEGEYIFVDGKRNGKRELVDFYT